MSYFIDFSQPARHIVFFSWENKQKGVILTLHRAQTSDIQSNQGHKFYSRPCDLALGFIDLSVYLKSPLFNLSVSSLLLDPPGPLSPDTLHSPFRCVLTNSWPPLAPTTFPSGTYHADPQSWENPVTYILGSCLRTSSHYCRNGRNKQINSARSICFASAYPPWCFLSTSECLLLMQWYKAALHLYPSNSLSPEP